MLKTLLGIGFRAEHLTIEQKFQKTFVRSTCVSDVMKSWKQSSTESIIDYFQPKMRMCRDLKFYI